MELISQHTKTIMEGCKERARGYGLNFDPESLEYIVTNRDLLELTPKLMIPTLYDYWVHDIEVLQEKGRYELYPSNPYETVINTRPAISFYNDNNPDWLNVMIFYHVLAHIDFFQNNLFFRNTWDFDFAGQALSDKRMIASLRSERGRWVDYIIEFTRGIDNLVGFHHVLGGQDRQALKHFTSMLDFYFDVFLQSVKRVSVAEYIKEIERFNDYSRRLGAEAERSFLVEVRKAHPEFEALFKRHTERGAQPKTDLIQFIMDNSQFLAKEENEWMKPVMQVVRNTSLFFQPQIRTKILNEGWASYWHEKLFLQDDRIKGHEVDFARVHSAVTALPRVGLNPYALGMRMFYHIEEMGDRGKYSMEFKRLTDARSREKFDSQKKAGQELIFAIRENYSDSMFISTFVDQDFVTRNNLFVTGKRLNSERMVWEYYVKSRKAEDYRAMLQDALYHPPHIEIDLRQSESDNTLRLVHMFEKKPLVKEYIANTLLGIEYLWGGAVELETNEVVSVSAPSSDNAEADGHDMEVTWQRVLYTMKNRKLQKRILD